MFRPIRYGPVPYAIFVAASPLDSSGPDGASATEDHDDFDRAATRWFATPNRTASRSIFRVKSVSPSKRQNTMKPRQSIAALRIVREDGCEAAPGALEFSTASRAGHRQKSR